MQGDVLPLQCIYGGKSELSHPKGAGAEEAARLGFPITCTDSHWSIVASMKDWFDKASFPTAAHLLFFLTSAGRVPVVRQYHSNSNGW
jgi:hypothetical protein